jgi:hypothetical protein
VPMEERAVVEKRQYVLGLVNESCLCLSAKHFAENTLIRSRSLGLRGKKRHCCAIWIRCRLTQDSIVGTSMPLVGLACRDEGKTITVRARRTVQLGLDLKPC